jgi:two-component system response regulator
MERLFPSIRIRVASNGADALEQLLADDAAIPDLVLSDLRLPRLSGLEVLAGLRQDARYRCVPIVILTSSVEREDIDQAYQLGANGFVRKPMQFDQYVEKFAMLLHYWLSVNTA